MTAGRPPLPASRPTIAAAIVAVALLSGACTTSGTNAPSGPAASASGAAASSAASAASAAPSAKPTPTPKVTQSDTAWGRIWDAVPASFPLPAGAEPTSPDRPASGAWSLSSGDPAAVTDQLKSGLEADGFTTQGVSGPLEDGSRIIDSVGKPSACHVQTRVQPLGTTITITVLFGASCPFR